VRVTTAGRGKKPGLPENGPADVAILERDDLPEIVVRSIFFNRT